MPHFRFPPTYLLGLTLAGEAVYWFYSGNQYGASLLMSGAVAAQAVAGVAAAAWSWRRLHPRLDVPSLGAAEPRDRLPPRPDEPGT